MTLGHVFELDKGTFGVLYFRPMTTVAVFLSDALTTFDVVRELKRARAGVFLPADVDTAATGRAFYKAQQFAIVI
jgi:hypothetical protein